MNERNVDSRLGPAELEELIIQTVPYAGFPTAIHALKLLREVVAAETP